MGKGDWSYEAQHLSITSMELEKQTRCGYKVNMHDGNGESKNRLRC